MELKGSRTEANLYSAFAGESQAMVKYRIYADRAKHEGYQGIAAVFHETALNEQAHAAVWLRYLHGGNYKETLANLQDAQAGEAYEWSTMYADYAKIAREEGFHEIAHRFEMVADVEKRHDNRYQTYIGQVKEDTVFHKAQSVSWICLNCGYICESKDVPKLCPICSYPQDYFEPYQK